MKIWFDVSGLYAWKNNFTGIQRVAYNLAKELSIHDRTASFFIFQHGGFHEITFKDLDERIKQNRQNRPKVQEAEKLSLSKMQHYGMLKLKATFRDSKLEPIAKFTYVNMRVVYRYIHKPKVVVHKHMFAKGDTVVIVDGNWSFSGYAEAMIKAKNKTNFKLIHFVHDLTALVNPAIVNYGADRIIGGYFKKILKSTDLIFAISESTKRDIEWYLSSINLSKKPKIKVLILGDNISPNKLKNTKIVNVPSPFILAVGTIEIRKNYMALYYCYKLAHQKGIDLPNLIIVGRRGWMAEEVYTLLTRDRVVNDKIKILQKVDDSGLGWLYQNCLFTVFPSFYEGWGLPIAESLYYGKCCISSNTSSMPEVGGDLVSYVSPYSADDMLSAILELCDSAKRSEAEARIKSVYKLLTWQDTYKNFKKELTELIAHPR